MCRQRSGREVASEPPASIRLQLLAVSRLSVRAFAHGFDVFARTVNRVASRKEQST